MIELGEICLTLSVLVSLYVAAVSFWGGATNNDVLIKSGQNGLYVLFGLFSISAYALMQAFVNDDFTIQYVYNYSNRDLASFYKFSAFWAGQKGSLLMWAWMLSGFGAIVVLQNRVFNRLILPYVVGIVASVLVLFSWLMSYSTPVFDRLSGIPLDGYGLNPMLQNPGMVFHPPTLYIGYVGFTIPFAFAMAALMKRQMGDVWIRSTRRWTIFSWFFLGMGNLLGANWAYVELGWGGYWAWDPVENASFMPWLVGTAYLHSVMIQEKKDMLKTWNMALVTTTFCLTIFGTFITRSGLIASVHSFGQTTVGYYFLGFLIISIVFSVYFIVTRREILRSSNELDSIFSRESSFLFNNLLLLGGAFAVFWGTLFPMISEAVRGVKITVGPPFFNKVMIPIGLALLLLTGICPLIAWRKASFANFKKNFVSPLMMALVSGVAFFVLGAREWVSLLFFTVAVFVVTTILMEVLRGVSARMSGGKENVIKAAFNLVRRNKRRYGGYIIHVGMVFLFVGFAGNSYNRETEATIMPGETITLDEYRFTYQGLDYEKPVPTKEEIIATVLLEKNGKKLGYLRPEKNFYTNFNQPNTEVAIHTTMKEDVYLIFAALSPDGAATFKIHLNALVKWIWVGGMIMGFGTIIVMWPDAREKKRFEARYAK